MKRLRYWFAGICIWFFFLYNVEKLGGTINIATFVYVLAIVLSIMIITIRPLNRVPQHWLFLATMPVFFLLKVVGGYQIGGANLAITVTEICAIGITTSLVGQIARALDEILGNVAKLTIGGLNTETQSFEAGQGEIYREIRRARTYQRPAALLSIAPTEKSVELSMNRYLKEAQREIIHEYISARVANLLVEELKDCDVITRRDGHFITLLPESNRAQVEDVVRRLKLAAKEKLGLSFNVGLATFPDEAVTFERLLERAEMQMTDIIDDNTINFPPLQVNGSKVVAN